MLLFRGILLCYLDNFYVVSAITSHASSLVSLLLFWMTHCLKQIVVYQLREHLQFNITYILQHDFAGTGAMIDPGIIAPVPVRQS